MSEHETLSGHWDQAASDYDQHFGPGPSAQYLRQTSLQVLKTHFTPGQRLLELGCGTGEEAVHLAQTAKVRITAIDISARMLACARRKAYERGVEKLIDFRQLSADKLAEFPSGSFQGAYSSFGVLNCLAAPELETLALQLHRLIEPGGFFISSVMNKYCLFELLFNGVRGSWKTAGRRFLSAPVFFKFAPHLPGFACHYYTPAGYWKHFKKYFSWVRLWAFPVLIPPPAFDEIQADLVHRKIKTLISLEKRVRSWALLNRLGDHFLLVLKRR